MVPLKWRVGVRNWLAGRRPSPPLAAYGDGALAEVAARAGRRRSDINEHLPTLYTEALAARARLIVELGVRGGESTFAFERAAAATGAKLVSVDCEACAAESDYAGWEFVRADDVAFAAEFAAWCGARGLEPAIDVLFLDTSHEREHTKREIAAWLPYLARGGKAIFHDTNLRRPFWRRDGSWNMGWDNRRGVVGALEDFLGAHWDEDREFVALHRGWLVRHQPWCAGLTILQRVQVSENSGV